MAKLNICEPSKKIMANLNVCEPYNFNIITVGASASGKTTFLRTVFVRLAEEAKNKVTLRKFKNIQKTTKIEEVGRFTIKHCTFALYDSVGYGDLENNSEAVQIIKDEIIGRHLQWLNIEGQRMSTKELRRLDNRIHCVFYFLNSRIKEIDIKFMKELSNYVPIVPIVSMADKLVTMERYNFFKEINNALRQSMAPIYDFEEDESLGFINFDDETDAKHLLYNSYESVNMDDEINQGNEDLVHSNSVFGTVGEALLNQDIATATAVAVTETNSNSNITTNTQRLPTPRMKNVFALMCSITGVREYPWCTINIENEEYSDFMRLLRMIFEEGGHLNGMRIKTEEMTNKIYYSQRTTKMILWRILMTMKKMSRKLVYFILVVLGALFIVLGTASIVRRSELLVKNSLYKSIWSQC